MDKIYYDISALGTKYNLKKIVLFGSRARGDNRERSDIDIAVYGLGSANQTAFRSDIDDLQTLLDFDVVFISDDTDAALLKNIKKDGVILMSKMDEKYSKYVRAVERLAEAINDYDTVKLDSVRDGVIQRFEFCTELAWKTLREYLLDQGYTDINSPKSVMKVAFADGLLSDEQGWLDILNARNLTSHVYDEKTAADVFEKISNTFLPLFSALIEKIG